MLARVVGNGATARYQRGINRDKRQLREKRHLYQNCIRGLATTLPLPHVAVRVWQMTWDGKGGLPAARTQSN